MTQIQQHLDELLALLDQETQVLSQVESQMQVKKDCLVTNNTAGLLRADQALMGLGRSTTQLEQQRMELMRQMGFGDQTLEQLVASLRTSHPAEGRRLHEARLGMRRLLESIRVLNRNTQELLHLSIQWIESTVELIARQVAPEGASYTAKGQKKRSKQQGTQTLNIESTIVHNA